jgi:hypothetical protein
MFSKTINAKCVGIKIYNKKTEKGTEYTVKVANILYENTENKNLKGLETESLKTSANLEPGNTYELVVVIQKVEEKYYKEIVSAKQLK